MQKRDNKDKKTKTADQFPGVGILYCLAAAIRSCFSRLISYAFFSIYAT